MNKRIKVLFMVILAFIIMMGFNNKIFAAKWSDLSQSQREELIQYADKDADIDYVETICKYSKKGENKKNGYDAIKYLFIYKDNHYATVSFDGSNCTNKDSKNGTNCLDGYRKSVGDKLIRGIRNWSANSGKNGGNDGVLYNLSSGKDAYLNYEVGKCPTYMSESVVNSNTLFAGRIYYLSKSNSVSSYTTLLKWLDEEKNSDLYSNGLSNSTDNYIYFNVPMVSSDVTNITSDLKCHYAEKGGDEQFYFTLTSTGIKDVTLVKNKIGDTNLNADPSVTMNTSLNFVEYLKYIEKDKCPAVIHGCEHQTGLDWYLEITGDNSASVNENFCKDAESWQKDEFLCIDDNCSEETICKATSELKNDIKDTLEKYASYKKNSPEKIEALNKYNKLKSSFRETCSSVLKTQDYNEHSCVSECLKLSETIATLEEENGLQSAYKTQECNIGEQVLSMVYNVLKWAKYIAPVLVIILSILDFIKALAAQSDDEMKKAQGKFVKRLIVAALLFLLPLIINFALKTFGMYNSSCDITDLF